MSYEPYQEPTFMPPEIAKRKADGKWVVWAWRLHPEHPLPPRREWHVHWRAWVPLKVFHTKQAAEKWLGVK